MSCIEEGNNFKELSRRDTSHMLSIVKLVTDNKVNNIIKIPIQNKKVGKLIKY